MEWSKVAIIIVVVIVLIFALEWIRRRHYRGAVFGYFTNSAYGAATFPVKGAALIAMRGELCIVEPDAKTGELVPKMYDIPSKNAVALRFNGVGAPSGIDALRAEWDDVTLFLVSSVKGVVTRWSDSTPMIGATLNGASSETSVMATTAPSAATKWSFHPISPATAWSMRGMAKQPTAAFLDTTKYPAWFAANTKLQESIKLGEFSGLLTNMKYPELNSPTTTFRVRPTGLVTNLSGIGAIVLVPTEVEWVFRAVNLSGAAASAKSVGAIDESSLLAATTGTTMGFVKNARDDSALASIAADTDAARWKLSI